MKVNVKCERITKSLNTKAPGFVWSVYFVSVSGNWGGETRNVYPDIMQGLQLLYDEDPEYEVGGIYELSLSNRNAGIIGCSGCPELRFKTESEFEAHLGNTHDMPNTSETRVRMRRILVD